MEDNKIISLSKILKPFNIVQIRDGRFLIVMVNNDNQLGLYEFIMTKTNNVLYFNFVSIIESYNGSHNRNGTCYDIVAIYNTHSLNSCFETSDSNLKSFLIWKEEEQEKPVVKKSEYTKEEIAEKLGLSVDELVIKV